MNIFRTTYKLTDILKKVINIFVKFFYDWKHFWFKIAHYNFWCEYPFIVILPSKLWNKVKLKKFKLIYSFLDKKYCDFINEYKTKEVKTWINTKRIWMIRWQWEDNMPEIVKICYNNLKKYNCGFEVTLLTKENYKDYIDLPDFILEKVSKGLVSLTHLADISRMKLLSLYWWMGVDATVFMGSDVLKGFSDINLNTSYPLKWNKKNYVFDKRSVFFIWWKTNRLFSFVYDFFMQYLGEYDRLINYFFMDYVIHIAYNHFDDVKRDIDACTIKNEEVYTLYDIFNEKYDEKKYKEVLKNWFFKLSFKRKLDTKTADWEMTNYWKFLEDNKL